MGYDFNKKNIVITGGSSGIGKALAIKLLNLGAKIWVLARDEGKIYNLINEIGEKSNSFNYYLIDVQDYEGLLKIRDEFKQNDIPIHGLINSAGVAHPAEFDKLEVEQYRWLMDVNYFGTVHTVLAFKPLMAAGSFIVNISSMAGLIGVYGYSAYGSSKFAVRGFSDVIRSELKLKDIHVSIVYPPDTDTPQLTYENKIKPAITKKIAGSANILSAANVAEEIIRGVGRKKYLIIPGFESKLIYHLSNILGPLFFPVMDFMVNRAVKEINRNK